MNIKVWTSYFLSKIWFNQYDLMTTMNRFKSKKASPIFRISLVLNHYLNGLHEST